MILKNFNTIVLLVLAGILGALSRYLILLLVSVFADDATAWGVFFINIVGCFGFGLLWPLQPVRKILLTGFMGSFTTFSSYIYDAYVFIQFQSWWLLLGNSFLQIILGVVALRLGFYAHRLRYTT